MTISIIFALGALHGLCLAGVLAFKQVNKFPNRLLSLLMLVFTVDLTMAAFHSAGLAAAYPHFIGLDYPITPLYGPLLFLYTKTLTENRKQLSSADWLHFVPFLLLLVYMIPFFAEDAPTKIAMIGSSAMSDRAWAYRIINHAKVVHGIGYIIFVGFYIYRHRQNLRDKYSSIEKVNLNWLKNLISGAAVLGLLAAVFHLLNSYENVVILGMGEEIYSQMTLLAVTAFVYGIGYMGLTQPEIFVNFEELESDFNPPKNTGKPAAPGKTSYQKSGLDEREAQHQLQELIRLMEQEKYYQNGDLNLADLANVLEIPPHNVTEILNRYLGKNFYDFVNEYRVEQVKKRLKYDESQNQTMLSIAMDAGFNSKSTFNSVFKKMTGMTPSEYRQDQT